MTLKLLTAVIAIYGAVLSSWLGYLTYRRERHRVRLFFMIESLDGPHSIAVYVVNQGYRPVTITAGLFVSRGEKGGSRPMPWDAPVLPSRLEDGDEIAFRFEVGDVYPGYEGFAVFDTHRREHRQYFTDHFARQLEYFRQMISESERTTQPAS